MVGREAAGESEKGILDSRHLLGSPCFAEAFPRLRAASNEFWMMDFLYARNPWAWDRNLQCSIRQAALLHGICMACASHPTLWKYNGQPQAQTVRVATVYYQSNTEKDSVLILFVFEKSRVAVTEMAVSERSGSCALASDLKAHTVGSESYAIRKAFCLLLSENLFSEHSCCISFSKRQQPLQN
jgi:hypothetical protein